MKLVGTESFDDFQETIKQIVASGKVEQKSLGEYQKIVPAIQDQAAKVAKTDDFKKEYIKISKKKSEEITQEDLDRAALDSVFSMSKQNFDETNLETIKLFHREINEINKAVILDDETLKALEKKSSGIMGADEFLKVYTEYEKLYKEYSALANALSL